MINFRFFKVIYFSFLLLLFSCNNTDGLFGHSESKAEAIANGSKVVDYSPNKFNYKLLDGTVLKVDTAWTEMSFTYKNNQKIIDTTFGYHFSIPFKKTILNSFTFSFGLLDTTNRIFTNGISDDLSQLCPRKLFDKMEVVLRQKNPDTAFGWTKPIITDTIIFTRIN